jgi:circadian clock protein KaiC
MDELMFGGIPVRDSVLIAGPSGSGKSTFAAKFIAAGLRAGEPAVIAVFEERPQEFVRHFTEFEPDLEEMAGQRQLELLYLRPLDLSVDEVLLEIQAAVERTGARRLVIDSLSGFELALAPTFREDFRESLYRLVNALTSAGVTVVMTAEVSTSFNDLVLSPNLVSFLTDDIILQRYVEIDGRLRKMMVVIKMRGSGHSDDLRLYEVGERGLVIGERITGYEGLIRGVAELRMSDSQRAGPTSSR